MGSARSARATRTRRRARSTCRGGRRRCRPTVRAGACGWCRTASRPSRSRGSSIAGPRAIYDLMNGIGAHEVVIETAEHDKQLKDLTDHDVTEVLFAFKARILDLRNDHRFRYILIFKNQGRQAGASLEHAHSQLIALPVTPRQVQDEIDGARRHYEHRERCIFCDMVAQERKDRVRLVYENEEFVVFAPWAPRSPFETWIVPKRHESNFEAEPKERLAQCASGAAHHAAAALGRAGRSALQLHPPLQPAARCPQPELPLAHRGDAGADAGGRLRVGLGLPHQPGPARGGGRVPAEGDRVAGDGDPVPRLGGGAALQDRRPGRRGRRAAGGAGRRWATRWRWSRRATASSTRPATASPRASGRCGCAASPPPSGPGPPAGSPTTWSSTSGSSARAAASTASTATSTATTPSASPASAAPRWRCRAPSATGRGGPPQRLADGAGGLAAAPEHAGDPALQRARSVFTIHNLAYQGSFPKELVAGARAALGALPPRRRRVPRPAQPPEGRAGLRRRHHHRLAHLRPRDRHARRAARGSTACCGRAPASWPGS